MKNLWALRYVFAMLLAYALAVPSFVWAVQRFPSYVGASIVILVVFAIVNIPFARRRRERTKVAVEAAFQESHALASIPPTLVTSSSYGYPAFKVTFGSKGEMEAAVTCNAAFKREIVKIFDGTGRWFDADKAIFFTYHGHLGELQARYRAARQS